MTESQTLGDPCAVQKAIGETITFFVVVFFCKENEYENIKHLQIGHHSDISPYDSGLLARNANTHGCANSYAHKKSNLNTLPHAKTKKSF